jgi:hypothetical protein
MPCPIRKFSGTMFGFTKRIDSIVVLNLLAIVANVSPFFTWYGEVPIGHVGDCNRCIGIQTTWPTLKFSGLMPGFSEIIAVSVVLNLLAILYKVSPGCTE